MERNSQEEIRKRSEQDLESRDLAQWVQAINEHIVDGQPAHFYINDEQAFQRLLELVGHKEGISSEQLIAFSYEATADERAEERGKEWNYWNGSAPVWDYLNRLGDIGMMLQFPNEFKASIAVTLDTETTMLYRIDMSTIVVVCEDCSQTSDPELSEEMRLNTNASGDPLYSCEHSTDEVDIRYSAAMIQQVSSERTYLRLFEYF